jgi:hypothetical protein
LLSRAYRYAEAEVEIDAAVNKVDHVDVTLYSGIGFQIYKCGHLRQPSDAIIL